jgi:hypothetical protein
MHGSMRRMKKATVLLVWSGDKHVYVNSAPPMHPPNKEYKVKIKT